MYAYYTRWLLAFLLLGATSALGQHYPRLHFVQIASPSADCDPDLQQCFPAGFWPNSLTIVAGDFVMFSNMPNYNGDGTFVIGAHNVVADDGSFRCAQGCDGEGGNGNPSASFWYVTRTFDTAGVVSYHDEVSHATGVIFVQGTPVPAFAIGPGITGAWFDPAQSGHGLIIEVLADNRLYASWFTFNPAGTEQAWFTGVGTYSGNTATITDVEQPTGGRWIPNFDPNAVVRHAWGTLSFTFTDCDHGRVDFNSTAGYGTGSMNLTRLTQPAGVACP